MACYKSNNKNTNQNEFIVSQKLITKFSFKLRFIYNNNPPPQKKKLCNSEYIYTHFALKVVYMGKAIKKHMPNISPPSHLKQMQLISINNTI